MPGSPPRADVLSRLQPPEGGRDRAPMDVDRAQSTGYVPTILKNPHALRSSSSACRTFSVSGCPAMSM
jgi:hypothetical protein